MQRLGWLALGLALMIGCAREPAPQRATADADTPAPSAILTNSIGMKLVPIPAGEFDMGSPDSDPEGKEDERPRHKVRISRAFHIGVHEVTQEEYERVMGVNPSFFAASGPKQGKTRVAGLSTARFPVERVSWSEAVEFCRKLSELPAEKQAGRAYRLPTEAEWEYACRAGTSTPHYFGQTVTMQQANFSGGYGWTSSTNAPGALGRTTQVGSYRPNPWGLYDMPGNVAEWCADWYDRSYYRDAPSENPIGPASGERRVVRGGEWKFAEPRECRSANRYADRPTEKAMTTGFRVVMAATGAEATPTVVEKPKPAPKPMETAPVASGDPGQGEDWPRWRGPRGDGSWRGPKLPERWPASGLRCLWRQPVGGGHSGVAVVAGKVYVQDYQKTPEEVERVCCFDAATGKPVWTHSYPVKYGTLGYANGPRSTPTVHDGRVYTFGTVGDIRCLEADTGKLLWSRQLVDEFGADYHGVERRGCGYSASPLIFEDLVIIHAGGAKDICMIAFQQQTGKIAWQSLSDPSGYATPILAEVQGTLRLLVWTPTHIRGLEPRTGKPLWAIPFDVNDGNAICNPICREDLLLICAGYEGTRALRLGPDPEKFEVAWEDARGLRSVFAAPLYRDGLVYLLEKRYGIVCFELKTGKKLWDDSNRTTPRSRSPHVSMAWTGDGDRALVLNADGELVHVRLNPAGCHELARAKIIGPTWAHVALAGRCAFARDDSELVCVSLIEPKE